MRVRLVLIAIALAVLAFAGRNDDQRAIVHHGSEASSGLAAQPAPDAEPPAIVRAAVTASAATQKHLACESLGHMRAAHDVSMASRRSPVAPDYDVARPRSIPLLI